MTALDELLKCGPFVTEIRGGVGEHAHAVVTLTKMRAKDTDVLLNGQRLKAVKSFGFEASEVGTVGHLIISKKMTDRSWEPSDEVFDLALAVAYANTGERLALIDCGQVRLGEPHEVNEKTIRVDLRSGKVG